jgi:tRNA A-37 threonylcarbamoyl transferase component Bud32
MSILQNKEYRPTTDTGQMETFSTEGIFWRLQSPEAPGWVKSSSGRSPQGRLVKVNVKRKVWQQDSFFVKQSHYRGSRKLLKRFSGGAARKEAEVCARLKDLGIPVPEVVAYGEDVRCGLLNRDLLVSRAVESSVNLDVFLETGYVDLPAAQKRELVASLAAFIKKLHEKGVLHPDLHLGNILYLNDVSADCFVLLDVDKIELKGRQLNRSEELKSLAILLNSVRAWTSRSERFRFLKAYGFSFDHALKGFIREVQALHLTLANRVWVKKSERCLHTNSRFIAEQRQGFSVWRKREGLSEEVLRQLLEDPDGLLESGTIVKAGNTVRAGIVTIGDQRFFLKRYNVKGGWYRLRNAFRRSRAARTWKNFWAFHVRNLPVPEPLVCIEERHLRLLGRSYILSEYLDGAQTLAEAWSGYDDERKQRVLIKLGLLLGEMHRACCLHGDLKWNNFLVDDDEEMRIHIIDLDGTTVTSAVDRQHCSKDLNRFLRDLDGQVDGARWKELFLRVSSNAVG